MIIMMIICDHTLHIIISGERDRLIVNYERLDIYDMLHHGKLYESDSPRVYCYICVYIYIYSLYIYSKNTVYIIYIIIINNVFEYNNISKTLRITYV